MDRGTTIQLGVCDFILFIPHGRLLLIECKTRTGKLTTDQMSWIAEMKNLGHTINVVRGWEEFESLVIPLLRSAKE
jgi:hypothetical protein